MLLECQPIRCLINRQRPLTQAWRSIAALIHSIPHTSVPIGWGQHSCGKCDRCAYRARNLIEHALISALGHKTESIKLPRAVGCPTCRGRGYSGRLPIFEALPIGPEEQAAIRQPHAEEALLGLIKQKNRPTLWSHGLNRVVHAETTLEEVLGVVEELGR